MTSQLIDEASATSWGAIFAGAICSAAVTLVLVAFGTGAGLSVMSPWSGEGMSASTTAWASGVFLIAVAMIASTIGGYITGRLRAGWIDIHADERYFRDTAHGFSAWALATVFTVAMLGTATTHILAGAASALPAAGASVMSGSSNNGASGYVDRILRSNPSAAQGPATGSDEDLRASVTRLLSTAISSKDGLPADDRSYLASLIASRSGLSQDEAAQRVDQTILTAKQTVDAARRNGAKLALWLAASMLAGAFSASLGATVGGALRNSTWWEASPPSVR